MACLSDGTAYITKDAGRYATRQDRTIYLHPADVSLHIPQDWLYWNTEFHNNLHLIDREVATVRFGAGEWDSEYGDIVNSALPIQDRRGTRSAGELKLRVAACH